MTLKEFFSETPKYKTCLWDEFTPFLKTVLCVIFVFTMVLPPILALLTLMLK